MTIKYLRKKHPDIKLYAVVSDICASGGYYVAAAADAIYAARGSIVGSIGVRLDNFGVQNLIAKLRNNKGKTKRCLIRTMLSG